MAKHIHNKKTTSPFYVILFTFLGLFSISLIALLLWIFFSAVKDVGEFRTNPIGLPKGHIWEWAWGNFDYVFSYFKMSVLSNGKMVEISVDEMIYNSILYVFGCSFMGTITPYVMAYATSKFDYKFSKVIYGIVIVTMILPIVGSTPSEIQVLTQLNIYDTFPGIWIQKMHFLGVYFLVFVANLKSTPSAYYEAASLDGASELSIMLKIYLPLIFNTAFTIFMLQVITYWNDYQTVLLFLPTHPTVSLGLFDLSNSMINGLNNVPMRMAGCLLVVVPMILIFVLFSDKLMSNVSMGGVKE